MSVSDIVIVTLLVAGLLMFIADKKKVAILLLAAGGAVVAASFVGCTHDSSQTPMTTATLKVERGWVSLVAPNGSMYSWRVDTVLFKGWNDPVETSRDECTAIISENDTDKRWHRYGLVVTGEPCWSPDNEFAVADSLVDRR